MRSFEYVAGRQFEPDSDSSEEVRAPGGRGCENYSWFFLGHRCFEVPSVVGLENEVAIIAQRSKSHVKFLTVLEVTLRRRISLAIVLSFMAALGLVHSGCSRSEEDGDSNEALTFDIESPPLQEKLGKDDGYAFAIFYGGDTHGSLETCG